MLSPLTTVQELYDEIESLSQERLASYIERHGVSGGRSVSLLRQ